MRTRAAFLALAAALGAGRAMLPCLLPAFTAAAAVCAASPDAEAATAREASLRHLVEIADVVVEGTPEESTSVWEEIPGAGRRIVTYTRVSVGEAVYGTSQKQVWVRTLGGVVGEVGQKVEGEAVLIPGQRSMLFLKATPEGTHIMVEMAQGHYLVKHDDGPRLRPSPHHGALVPMKKEDRERARPAREALTGKLVTEAVSLIRAERKAAGR